MRLFVAIELSREMRDVLIDYQNQLYDAGVRGNYSLEENLHLTLAFIGEMPNSEPVMDTLSSISFKPFELELQGTGSFGNLWWAGLKESAPLEAVARRVRRALSDGGIPFDKSRFRPHITVLRKASFLPGTMSGLSSVRLAPASTTVDEIILFRSDRGRNGMIYTGIGRIDADSHT